MHDTFYLPAQADDGSRKVLRTHTSPVQIRTMMRAASRRSASSCPAAPIRCDHDATHTPMFHQVEGLVIDETTHMGHLKGCLHRFLPRLLRRRRSAGALPPELSSPSPSPRPRSISAARAPAASLKIGAGDDWLEILGCGMVHPKVLANCGIDPDE